MPAQLQPMVQCASWEKFRREVKGSKGDTWVVTHEYTPPPAKYMYGFHCTCPAFRFSGEKQTCKHVQAIKGECCLWHDQFDEPYNKDGKCPRCGGPVQSVLVAV